MPKSRPWMERFFEKVRPRPDDCWLWTACKNKAGYGVFSCNLKANLAHKFLYEKLVEAVPDGLELDHLCRSPACVNPEHLEPVSSQENILRGVGFAAKNKAKTHCPLGHPYEEGNIYWDRGARKCRTCTLSRVAARAARIKRDG